MSQHRRNDEFCKVLCQVKLNGGHVAQFKKSIDEAYHHNWCAAAFLFYLCESEFCLKPPFKK